VVAGFRRLGIGVIPVIANGDNVWLDTADDKSSVLLTVVHRYLVNLPDVRDNTDAIQFRHDRLLALVPLHEIIRIDGNMKLAKLSGLYKEFNMPSV
jgi:hypothetical protein